ncbi:MAG: endolytic transglycosylase MltG [Candidatus Yonathbacteria bacterium]|nr:endolytic transglycosylase MltG [Candidatus Yonathbacteria bacterium]
MDQIIPENDKETSSQNNSLWALLGITTRKEKIFFGLVLLGTLFVAFLAFFFTSPSLFPLGEIITVKKGSSLGEVSFSLKEGKVIRSQTAFELCMRLIGGDKHVVAGDYLFKTSLGACSVASRITKGISGIPSVRATIPEGTTNQEIANILTPFLSKFDAKIFLDRAREQEGYLFPDTYFFFAGAEADDVIKMMGDEFQKKIDPWKPLIEETKHSLRDSIIMASIIEREAKTEDDQALVSGILWKRIEMDIPIQVDAPFYYLLGKTSSELTQSDLAIKSAYNTYKNKGLPAGPIGNPGLSAIRAAVRPKKSSYLYYLSDEQGTIHYATSFEEHKANKAKYLR